MSVAAGCGDWGVGGVGGCGGGGRTVLKLRDGCGDQGTTNMPEKRHLLTPRTSCSAPGGGCVENYATAAATTWGGKSNVLTLRSGCGDQGGGEQPYPRNGSGDQGEAKQRNVLELRSRCGDQGGDNKEQC